MSDDDWPGSLPRPPRGMYYDRDGVEITGEDAVLKWGKLHEDWDYRQVGDDYIPLPEGGTVRVSTVWLGINHGWGGGPPIIFETMVFSDEIRTNDVLGRVFEYHPDLYMQRYSTLQQAKDGHAALIVAIHERLVELEDHDREISLANVEKIGKGDDE